MASLTGSSIASSYTSLLKLNGNTDNIVAGDGSNAIQIVDGDGTASPLYLNTDRLGIGIQPATVLDVSAGVNSAHSTFSGQAGRGLLIETQATTNNDDTVVLNAQTSTGEIAFETNSIERMRIDSNGKTRITASTAEVLSLRSGDANGSHIIFEESTTARGYVGIAGGVVTSGGDNFVIRSEADLLFASGGNNTIMTIDSAGNVGIGSDSPNQFVEIKRASRTTTFDAGDSDTWADILVRNPQTTANSATGIAFQLDTNYHTNASTGICAVHGTGDYEADMAFITRGNAVPASEKMRLSSSGFLGLGLSGLSPDYPLHVSGGDSALYLVGSTQARVILRDAGATSGSQAFDIVSVDDVLKIRRLNDARSSVTNTSLILDANSRISLSNNDSGTGGVDSSSANTIFGYLAGANIGSEAHSNTLLGHKAGNAMVGGRENVAIGTNALDADQYGEYSIAIGSNALGAQNDSSNSADDGIGNIGIGRGAGAVNVSGTLNTYIGHQAGYGAGGGSNSNNVGIGANSLLSINTGSQNTAVGKEALKSVTTGQWNTALGDRAGDSINTGSANICIGTTSDASAAASSQIAIGNAAISGGGNAIAIGENFTASANNFSFGKASNVVTNDFTADNTWSQSSDVRKKRNIKDAKLGLDFINDLRTVTYQWKPNYDFPKDFPEYNKENYMNLDVVMHGMIAQEVKEAIDKSGVERFGGWKEDENGSQMLSKEMFVFPLIKAVQELSAKVIELSAKVTELENK